MSYEKRFQADGSFKIWEVKHKRYVSEDQSTYVRYVERYGADSVKVVEYVAPVVPEPYVPSLDEVKTQKKQEITSSYNNAAANGGCHTGIIVDGKELIVDYSVVDREIWSKGIIAAAMASHASRVIQLSDEELAWCNSGVIAPSMMEKAKNIPTTVRAHDNTFFKITLGEMHQAAIAQNFQVQKDLERKWALEAMVDSLNNIDEIQAINWDTKIN